MSRSLPMSFGRIAAWLHRLHDGLNHDFCPWANRWVYWLKHPFWIVLASALTAILCGIFVSPIVLAFGAGLAVLLVLGVIWPWLSLRGVEGSFRFIQTRGRAGQPVSVEIELTNRWPWPVWGLEVARGFFHDSQDKSGGLALACVAGWSTSRVTWNFSPSRRGVYPLMSPQIESGFPFGLYRACRELTAQNELVVWPRSTVLDVLPDAVEIESREDRTSDRRAGDVGDILGTRGFRQGDSLRRVHWAQSARQGRLIVCERQVPVSCALRIVLDLHPQHHPEPGRSHSLEQLLSVAASILESLHREPTKIECVIERNVYKVGSSLADLKRCLDALARIPANGLAYQTPSGWCGGIKRQRALVEYVLTTSFGFSRTRTEWRTWESAHFVVLKTPELLRRDLDSEQSGISRRPWLELSMAADVLVDLPRDWRRACRAN